MAGLGRGVYAGEFKWEWNIGKREDKERGTEKIGDVVIKEVVMLSYSGICLCQYCR